MKLLLLFKIATVAFIYSINVTAAELLPFPEVSRPLIQTSDQEKLRKFKLEVDALGCKDLDTVKEGLEIRVADSVNPSPDHSYYNIRLDIVKTTKANKKCKIGEK